MWSLISLVEQPLQLSDDQVEFVAENIALAFPVSIRNLLIGHGASRHFLWQNQTQRLDNSGAIASGASYTAAVYELLR
jgi:hypothetical protein